jgi:hypothetical protein
LSGKRAKKEKINFDNKSGLKKLFNTIKNRITIQKHGDKIIEDIREIIRVIRNTYAHDNPKIATKEESELVWHAVMYLVNELRSL